MGISNNYEYGISKSFMFISLKDFYTFQVNQKFWRENQNFKVQGEKLCPTLARYKNTQSHIFFLFSFISLLCYSLHKDVSCYYSRKCYFRVTFEFHCILWTILSNPLALKMGTKYTIKILSLRSSLEVPISFCLHSFPVISIIFSNRQALHMGEN